MAEREFYIGSFGPFFYDDTDTYGDGTPFQGIYAPTGKITATPVDDDDIPNKVYVDDAAGDAIVAHVGASDPHTGYQRESEKDAASGYAGLNASSRVTKGIDTVEDIILDTTGKGLVLKDTQGTPHYWRISIDTAGALVATDLGTSHP